MHTGPGLEGVLAKHRVVVGDVHARGLGREFDVVAQHRQVVVDQAQQAQIDQQQVHFRVAGAFADAQRRGVHARRTRFQGRQRIHQAHAAVAVPVPVDAHRRVQLLGDAGDIGHQPLDAIRRRMAAGVAHAHALGPGLNRRGIQRPHLFRSGARRVFRHEHAWQPILGRKGHGVLH